MTRLLLVAAVVVWIAAAGVGAGATWDVYQGGSIQATVNAASPGDTIYVHSGTYVENVDVDKRVTLVGDGADVVTVRAADATDHVFDVTADWVNISGFTVTGATCGDRDGIHLYRVEHCNIFDNNAPNNCIGIDLWYSKNNMLQSNNVSNNVYGIELGSSSDNRLQNNTANSNSYGGIFLWGSSDNMLTSNTMSGNMRNFDISGHSLSCYTQCVDTSNTVDGKPIYYWVDKQDEQIPDDAGFVGVVNSRNITVKDLILTNNGEGVLFAYTEKSKVENVTASNNGYGISLWYSKNNMLQNNNVSNNDCSIWLYSSSNNILANNKASDSSSGIRMERSSNNTLQGNTANSNDGNGIYLWGCDNTLTNNVASSNDEIGIYLYSSSSNLIYHNNFLNNPYGNAHEYSCGTNTWDSGSSGNYYSDYNGTDNNTDGIGDTPHPIPGGTSIDRFPLMHPWTGGTSQKGDLNHDGTLTSADILIALQIAVSGEYVPEADIDENGCVNALDARMIMRAAAGRIEL